MTLEALEAQGDTEFAAQVRGYETYWRAREQEYLNGKVG